MRVVFLADPIDRLKPKGDSSLAMLRSALRKGWQAHWALASGVEFRSSRVGLWARPCRGCVKDALPELGEPEFLWADELGALFIRKDPPFDASYLQLCWLLSLAEPKLWMLNRPSLLVRYHEKLLPLEALAEGYLLPEDLIPTHIGGVSSTREFVEKNDYPKVVRKPFLGYGGNGVELLTKAEFLKGASSHPADVLVQPFVDAIYERGDRRVFFLGGELIADFVRVPKEGGFISNLAQGGTAVSLPMTAAERKAAERLGKFLKKAGIDLAGADLIGAKVSEVNITSPTGLRSLEALDAHDYADDIMTFVERGVALRKR